MTFHFFGVTGIECSIEKSARWINLLQETTESPWWHIQNGQNTFLGRFFALWESFQGGVCNLIMIFDQLFLKDPLRHVKPQNGNKRGKYFFNNNFGMEHILQS